MEKRETTEQTTSAEAENMETMDLLTGMLDNATHCGSGTPDQKRDEEAPENPRESTADTAR